ncbi:class I SAM-dependent methyltransferase [Caldalkalibacillus salinus]|uniref:class I SAM-dependent methyltransferase n=1 Tax=Caldalkalibacillus salinus TaxID=2803787 RepID=UPI0019228761|nr:class I SAM-dependent methyltransferase [Caldalkalibacillus salinus]
MSEPWYIESFREDYLKIYAHRTDEAARLEVEQIISLLNMKTGTNVLDLCCGNGRHSRALAQKGFKVTGLDLSEVLLQDAREKSKDTDVTYIHGDVRHLPFTQSFDYVLNLFTSFGYFEEMEENKKVFDSIKQSLKPEGQYLIDFLNPEYVKANLVPESFRKVGDIQVTENRRIEKQKVIKDITVQDGSNLRYYQEQVNLFHLDDMCDMLSSCHLEVTDIYGQLDREPYNEVHSPRMIIVGRSK